MNFQRARSQDQINNRIQEIIDAASSIYNTHGYEGLSFSVISELTHFTRPSIYKYFKTKDEILLVLLKDDLESFVSTLIGSFKINKLYSLSEITEIWTDTLMIHERLLDLYAILFTIIEKNVSVESLAAFKKDVINIQSPLFQFVVQLFPNADTNSIEKFVYSQLILAFGLYPMSKLSPLQADAVKLAGVNYTPPNFKEIYMASFYPLVYCLENSISI